jgi:fructokinase
VPVRIGIDLGGTKIEGVALEGTREAARMRVNTPREDYDETLVAVASLVDRLDPAGSAPGRDRNPGRCSASNGCVKNANSTW